MIKMGICSIGPYTAVCLCIVIALPTATWQATTPGVKPTDGDESSFPEAVSIEGSPLASLNPVISSVFISDGVGSFDSTSPVHTSLVELVLNTVSIEPTTVKSALLMSQTASLVDLVQSSANNAASPNQGVEQSLDFISGSDSIQIASTSGMKTVTMLSTIITELYGSTTTLPEQLQSAENIKSFLALSSDLNTQDIVPTRTFSSYTASINLESSSGSSKMLLDSPNILEASTDLVSNLLMSSLYDSSGSPSVSVNTVTLNTQQVTQSISDDFPILSSPSPSSIEWTKAFSDLYMSSPVLSYSLNVTAESRFAGQTVTPTLPLSATIATTDLFSLISTDEMTTLFVSTPTPSLSYTVWPSSGSSYELNESLTIMNSFITATPSSDIYATDSYISDFLDLNISQISTVIVTYATELSYYETTPLFPEATSLLDWNTTNTVQYLDETSIFLPHSTISSDNIMTIGAMDLSSIMFSNQQLSLNSSEIFMTYSSIDMSGTELLPTAPYSSAVDSLLPTITDNPYTYTMYTTNTPVLTTTQSMNSPNTSSQTPMSLLPSPSNLPTTSEINPTPWYEAVSPTIAWPDNTTLAYDNATDVYNFTETPDVITTTPRPTPPESVLNTSDAWADYWVKTILKVPTAEDVESSSFRRTMETTFAEILNEGLQRLSSILAGNYKPLRRRRAVTAGNATVQMTNISRSNIQEPSHTTLVYYLVEEKASNNITSADRTVGLMELFDDQELAIILGYQVVLKAEPYIIPPPPKDKKLWIIGAVIGGLAGLIIIVWCILFTYFKCTNPPTKMPSPRSPRSAKIADIDQVDYKGKDVKGFDYARTEVGLENELDRQNVPDYYRSYPMGSTELEGMYSPGETPPPPFRGHRPSSGGSQGRSVIKGESSQPPPPPPINGFIAAVSVGETQAKPSSRKKNKTLEDSTEHESDSTQAIERSEDRKPLSKKGHRRHRPKKSGSEAGKFENLTKMGRVDDPEALAPPTRTTLHAIKTPILNDSLTDNTLPEIPTEKDVEDTLRQKADLERYRNKQRQREKKSGQRKHPKHGDSKKRRTTNKGQQEVDQVLENGQTPDKPKRKKKVKKPSQLVQPVDSMELQAVPDYRVIQPITPSMQQQIPPLGHLESDSSDDGLNALDGSGGLGSHDRQRELVSALLNEAFAMATPTPTSGSSKRPVIQQQAPPEPLQPPPQLHHDPSSRHTPLYVTPVKGRPGQLPGTWDPYEASDKAAHIVPPGHITPVGSYSSLRSPRQRSSAQRSPRSPHQYTNPAYMGDIPLNIGLQPLQNADINDASTPHIGRNITNGFMPDSQSAFMPYERPNWTESIPPAWEDPDKTLSIGNRFSGKQLADNDPTPKSKSPADNMGRYHIPKPVRRVSTDDEVDIVSDVMKAGSSAQPLIASIREEIERLAKRSQDSNSLQLPTT